MIEHNFGVIDYQSITWESNKLIRSINFVTIVKHYYDDQQ